MSRIFILFVLLLKFYVPVFSLAGPLLIKRTQLPQPAIHGILRYQSSRWELEVTLSTFEEFPRSIPIQMNHRSIFVPLHVESLTQGPDEVDSYALSDTMRKDSLLSLVDKPVIVSGLPHLARLEGDQTQKSYLRVTTLIPDYFFHVDADKNFPVNRNTELSSLIEKNPIQAITDDLYSSQFYASNTLPFAWTLSQSNHNDFEGQPFLIIAHTSAVPSDEPTAWGHMILSVGHIKNNRFSEGVIYQSYPDHIPTFWEVANHPHQKPDHILSALPFQEWWGSRNSSLLSGELFVTNTHFLTLVGIPEFVIERIQAHYEQLFEQIKNGVCFESTTAPESFDEFDWLTNNCTTNVLGALRASGYFQNLPQGPDTIPLAMNKSEGFLPRPTFKSLMKLFLSGEAFYPNSRPEKVMFLYHPKLPSRAYGTRVRAPYTSLSEAIQEEFSR